MNDLNELEAAVTEPQVPESKSHKAWQTPELKSITMNSTELDTGAFGDGAGSQADPS